MPLQQRVESLKKKHADIDERIRTESGRAACDDVLLHRLKAEKLAIKDDLDRLQKDAAYPAPCFTPKTESPTRKVGLSYRTQFDSV